ncbi:hypothetical protein [Chitinophaga nivalis]|uniref:Membrane or secreted protein n=1 Tax=Chitinophaga nivalis TaxID=2991709 RepID=A0ABT3IRD2_9BACT|nr:hypothetical protein [Chitinophaga nivalis]MCW3463783.1 hypothetical protein [Chitinophaga nivalis]MCW3486527.1 hypothetical protein [Chitinophaga nivalis]
MKTLFLYCTLLFTFLGGLKAQQSPLGAWKATSGEVTGILLITPAYFSITEFRQNEFIATYGGTWKAAGDGQAAVEITFNSAEKTQVGQATTAPMQLSGDRLLTATLHGGNQEWTRLDNGTGELAGCWQITAREQQGKLHPIANGDRKTLKILTGSRFQWIAINTATGEFFGTGGGTYSFENGTYTEKIDFFSRDNARVGATLTFKGKVTDNSWDYQGLSSKGEALHEIWSRNYQPMP